ncbi:MAG: hypothetical protein AVDCRST_MAG40-2551, partial [uncultured Gemmatimonadaceae bacterium]
CSTPALNDSPASAHSRLPPACSASTACSPTSPRRAAPAASIGRTRRSSTSARVSSSSRSWPCTSCSGSSSYAPAGAAHNER